MLRLRCAIAVALGLLLLNTPAAFAQDAVGEAVQIKTEVTGEQGPLVVSSSVYRDERIRTSKSGLGQFVFRDGTKLAVGWGSSVVIDRYVFDDSDSVKRLSIKAAKGTFRWISGSSKSSAYQILTPAGTIGVRGTAFDFYVGPDGTTAVVLLNGAAQFCGPGGCRQLTQRCDCVIAKRNGAMTDVRPVDRNVLDTLGTNRALPFLSGNQRLSGMMGTSCGMTAALRDRRDPVAPAPRLAPPPPPPPEKPPKPPKPDKPHKPHKPDKPHRPDRPDRPDKPDGHHHGGGHGRGDDGPGRGGRDHDGNGRDHSGWGGKGRGWGNNR